MIVNVNITNDYVINNVRELNKLNMEGIKVNKTKIARELGVSRDTVRKYMNGFTPSSTRNKPSKLDVYYETIYDLLFISGKKKSKIFHYKRNLYNYCVDNKIITNVKETTFKEWLSKKEKLNNYFKSNRSNKPEIRFETSKGEQAQLDWKEDIEFILNTGEVIHINILVVLLSYSRYRYYGVSLSKSQDVLFNHINNAFETFDGVPKALLTDNMKTVMDVSRTKFNTGKVNNRFQSFADDYGFKVQPCIAGMPQTKAKVESPMRILDYIQSFNGDLSYLELVDKVRELNEKENNRYHEGYGLIPKIALQKEKDFLTALPKQTLRNPYNITNITATVDKYCMISYKSNKYSVSSEYLNKKVSLQIYDNKLHIYFNTKLITIHNLILNTKGQLIYHECHYQNNLKISGKFKENDINDIAADNLKKIGEKFNDSIPTIT